MQRHSSLMLVAIGIGILFTTITAAAAYFASRSGSNSLSQFIFWPNTALQALVPAANIGSPEHPIYESTPLNILAFIGSFPVATFIYALIAYMFLRHQKV